MKNLIVSLSLVVLCLSTSIVFSQTSFTGAISNDWAEAGNWDNGLPAMGNDATIPSGSNVVIAGFIFNDGTIDNYGSIENYNGGTIFNDGGTIDNYGSIINDGTINNDDDGTINNDGAINNDGTIYNEGTIENFDSILNVGTIDNYGGIVNYGTINSAGTINNYAAIFNEGTINQCGFWGGGDPAFNPYTPCAEPGCTDTSACNYDAAANPDDGSCESLSCADCCGVPNGDGTTCDGVCGACNDDTSCVDACGVPNGDNSTCSGCTYTAATNYDSTATIDDGSCVYAVCDITSDNQEAYDEGAASVDITSDNQAIYDGAYEDGEASVVCADITSDNQEAYNEGVASVDITSDNQAIYDGAYEDGEASVVCADITSDNQDAYDEGAASVCPGDFSGDGNVNVSDLGGFLGAFGTPCSTSTLLGCTDSAASNYNPLANTDDGACEYDSDEIERINFDIKNINFTQVGEAYQVSVTLTDPIISPQGYDIGLTVNLTSSASSVSITPTMLYWDSENWNDTKVFTIEAVTEIPNDLVNIVSVYASSASELYDNFSPTFNVSANSTTGP